MEVTCNMSEQQCKRQPSSTRAAPASPTTSAGAVVLVTGAARGMGRDIARRFAGFGASVVASDVASHVDALGYEVASLDDLERTVAGDPRRRRRGARGPGRRP